ncbi:MAG TPA: Uma2 family endonuclease [Bryobacteraceae bacterium]
MATATQISVDEYLRTDYAPPCELVSGELIPKPMGTLAHMNMERRTERVLEPFEQQGIGHALHELFCRIGDDIRIPDVVFYAPGARFEKGVLVDPPLLAVEILSPSQRQSELFAKCEEYHSWGVPYCWVVDPVKKSAWEYHREASVQSKQDALEAGEIRISLADLFA